MTARYESLVHMLRVRAETAGAARAYTFLQDGEVEGASFTFGELELRARAIAVLLQDRGIRPGDRVLLLYPPGIDFVAGFFGTLFAGAVAVPCYPPHPAQLQRVLPRLLGILANAEPAAVLTSAELAGASPRMVASTPALAAAPWLATDASSADAAALWRPAAVDASSLALLQYTSGSTAAPRGVMVTHGNLLHNLAFANAVEDNDAASVSVCWLPVIHDMGLIEGLLEPAYAGFPVYVMSPAAFLQRPIRWLRAISRYRATNSGGPNFAYDLCTRKITPEQRATLDLSSWRVAYNGAEPIRAATLESFHRTFSECGFQWRSFYPVYGLAEATLAVSSGGRADEPRLLPVGPKALVSCGPPDPHADLRIVDPETRREVAAGSIGEVWIASPSVARGYWRRDDETRDTFRATIDGAPGTEYLRTGDLGALIDGELVIAGRIKDVLIVRGMKLYPQDLELTMERQHEAIRPGCTAAFSIDGGEAIGVAIEVDLRRFRGAGRAAGAHGDDEAARLQLLVRMVRQAVAQEHGVELQAVTLLPPGAIPKTSSGKIRRRACAEAFSDGSLGELLRWTPAAPRHATEPRIEVRA